MILFLFWISLLLLFYIYFGYPLLLAVLTRSKPARVIDVDSYVPLVTLVVAARNEDRVIARKIQNCEDLNYPKEKLEILIMSDQSTDRTNEIVQEYPHVTLVALEERQGKTQAQNLAVQQANGEIVVFSDANAMYDRDAIQYLVRPFADDAVDFVSGDLSYHNPNASVVGEKESLYWRYEKFIKRHEDKNCCITGANGSIYAVRKTSYVPLALDMISDFMEPLLIAGNGGTVVYEPAARSFEESSYVFEDELNRKRRILSRSLHSLAQHAWLLNPFKTGMLAFQIWSHKILRWLTPVFVALLYVANFILVLQGIYKFCFILLLVLLGLAAMGYQQRTREKMSPLVSIPYYFGLLNVASVLGIRDFLAGKHKVFWEPIRK